MKIEEYRDLPEGAGKEQLKSVYVKLFEDFNKDSYEDVYKKLEIICDKQWHTSELPGKDVQEMIRNWIVNNWTDSQKFYELVIGLCYCFGLEKELYTRALNLYHGEYKNDYEKDLEQSKGDCIDPYWSMRVR